MSILIPESESETNLEPKNELLTQLARLRNQEKPLDCLNLINNAYSSGELSRNPTLLNQIRQELHYLSIWKTAFNLLNEGHESGDREMMPGRIRNSMILGMHELPESVPVLMPLIYKYGVQTYEPVKKVQVSRRGFFKIAGLATGVAAIAATSHFGPMVGESVISAKRKSEVEPVKYDVDKTFRSSKRPGTTSEPTPTQTSPTALEKPTKEPTKEPSPTPEPTETPKEIVGDKNIVEFFLGDLINQFKEIRKRRALEDGSFKERIYSELLDSDKIFYLLLGVDETRERANEFSHVGQGRSDIVMLISFDPKTLGISALSFPRDLFVPELLKYTRPEQGRSDFLGEGAKINEVTKLAAIGARIDGFHMISTIVEEATGVPIDGIMQTNIDFMKGHVDGDKLIAGIFDSLFPDGLNINVPRRIVDTAYPVGYGTTTLVFEPGSQMMGGGDLTKYARTRHADSDFGRNERQRQILKASVAKLFPAILVELGAGETDTIDQIIEFLEIQDESDNLFYDVNIIEIVKTIRNNLLNLRRNRPDVLAGLVADTMDEGFNLGLNVLTGWESVFNLFGLSRENGMLINLKPGEVGYTSTILKVAGSTTTSAPTKLGNYLEYWQRIRQKAKDMFS